MATTDTLASPDGSVSVSMVLEENDDGTWALHISPTLTTGQTLTVDVNGEEVFNEGGT